MADEKNVAKAKEQAKEPNKFVKFFKDLPANVARPFRNMWHELRKVTWPTKQDHQAGPDSVFSDRACFPGVHGRRHRPAGSGLHRSGQSLHLIRRAVRAE